MKYYFFTILSIFFLSSCVKQDPIPQSELSGIWKLNGYSSTRYKVEITDDNRVYWYNYNDLTNRDQEFELEYNINNNTMKLYCPGGSSSRHTLKVQRNRKNRLSFTNIVYGTDANGDGVTNYDTYYKMN
jgi:hypothetical protein